MKKQRFSDKKYFRYSLLLILGIFLGWLFFHTSDKDKGKENSTAVEQEGASETVTTWTCSMHPQIRIDQPGDCPICGMDLIPVGQGGGLSADPDAVHISREAAQLANVLTSTVSRQNPVKEIRLYGKVQADERLNRNQVAHVPGRIESLTVNFTGETVRNGEVLAEIYSPELITAQQELLETAKTKQIQPELYEASKEKLRQWKLSEDQIDEIESSEKIINNFNVLSGTSGTVIARRVNTGDYVSAGTVLYEIADLSKVWVMFDAYESDLQFLGKGKKITFTLQAFPGSKFSGTIAFIDPVIDPVTRVAKVRVEVPNKSDRLKPEMFASGVVSSDLNEYRNEIVIPRSSVLWTGKRSIVYVRQPETDEPVFKMREIELGPSLGESYVVVNGLTEGEEIVTSGTFSVDASAQLEGKPSMMNPAGGKASTGHDHGAMTDQGVDMPDSAPTGTGKTDIKKISINMDFIMQLNDVYDHYIILKNALVESNPEKTAQESDNLKKALEGADMKLLSGDAHTKWMDMLKNLNNHITTISKSGDIEKQRTAFSDLSDQLYSTIKTFGLMGKTVYYQFCPMAKNDKGAYWLSEIANIRNPYFGEQMMECGETREVLKY